MNSLTTREAYTYCSFNSIIINSRVSSKNVLLCVCTSAHKYITNICILIYTCNYVFTYQYNQIHIYITINISIMIKLYIKNEILLKSLLFTEQLVKYFFSHWTHKIYNIFICLCIKHFMKRQFWFIYLFVYLCQ